MAIDEAGLMAAVNAGIADADSGPAPTPTPTPAPEGNADESEATPNAADPAASADGQGDGTGKEGVQADDGGDASADGVADGGDGVPAAGDKPAVVKTPEEVAAEAAAAAAEAARPKDPLNDPLPNALKKETKERIQTLVGMVKENTTKLEGVTRERDEIFNAIVETRATPEQYGQALQYLRMVNSANRADREGALQFMQQEVAALARMLGKPVPGVNMLEGHQDLIDEVATGRLAPERAQEIAASRHAAQYEVRRGEATNQNRQQVQQQAQQKAAGVRDLNALEAQLNGADPVAYQAKRKILIESLKPVFAQIHPSQWAATFKRVYDAMPVPAAPRPTPTPTPTPRAENTPLRASNPAGAARPAPSSLLEAVSAGIADAR